MGQTTFWRYAQFIPFWKIDKIAYLARQRYIKQDKILILFEYTFSQI